MHVLFTAFTFIYLSVLLVWSGLAVVGQVLFQIVLLTDYSDQLQPCKLTSPYIEDEPLV